MSYKKIINQSKYDKKELFHLNSELIKRKAKNVPISSRTTGFLYGIVIKEIEEIEDSIEQIKIDEPLPEGYGELYTERKKIIFGNLIENDYMIGQFILKTQLHMIAISKKKSFFSETNLDIYNIMITLKETIANYVLIIKLYLMRQNYNRALELFLLMIEKNKTYIDFIYRRIKEHFPKLSNANRIGKFYPSITKKYIEVLSCLIKLSDKLNRNLGSDIVAGKGELIATECINKGVDPYITVAIILHETGCGTKCSNLARYCYNFGGQKGKPSCNGGAFRQFDTIDEGLVGMIDNLSRNYFALGLNTPETIGPKYCEGNEWAGHISWFVNKIRSS